MFIRLSASASLLALVSVPAFAQDRPASDEDAYHAAEHTDIVVTAALPALRKDALSGVAVLRGADLVAALRPSLGDTLAHTPGVTATSFGPSASRPVLRGLQGERVKLLTNGIGSIDVSNTSVDHAPAINPLLAQRIEVLRGPQSLQYGSAAIGGVVNVIDKRVPTSVPDEPLHLAALAGYASAAHERNGAASAEAPLGGGWVGHVDASWAKSDDLRIAGFALTPALRREALGTPEFAANAALAGRLPNTAARTWSAGAGAARIDAGGNIGAAYSHFDSFYGVPLRLATQPGQHEEAPRLHIRQDRIDARAELTPHGSVIDRASFRYAYGDYTHVELEPDGAAGTRFHDSGMEGRLELAQADRGGWRGASGLQFMNRAFAVEGEEAFLPRNGTSQFGLFTLQQYDAGPWKLEAGARYERTRHTATPLPGQGQFFAGKVGYSAVSGALGAAYALTGDWKLGLNLSRAERAPAAEELFANGPHAGTESFEIGDPGLGKEAAWSIEAILRGGGPGYSVEASAYHSWFGNFVYSDRTGATQDGLPVYQARQADARLYGFEAQASAEVLRAGDWALTVEALADYVHATIAGSGPAPRIPPLRLLGGVKARGERLELGAEVERVTAQTRVAPHETATPGYTVVNLAATWHPTGEHGPLVLVLSANNLFDVTARRHASYLKDYAPLAGRDIRLSARWEI